MNNIIDFNKKMIGKRVSVEDNMSWRGVIVGVVDEENFLVKNRDDDETHEVSMFDIRSE